MKNLIMKIDQILCDYLGLENEIVLPRLVKVRDNKITVISTEPYKRHVHINNWDDFNQFHLKQTSRNNREKLGIAVGKRLAKNLVISFDELQINKEN